MRSNRLALLPIIAAISLGGALAASPTADASPRFTVVNDTKASIKVMIFNGGDTSCDYYTKKKTIAAGKTNTYGCTGNGKGQCKVVPRTGGEDICDDLVNTCSGYAIKVAGDSTLKISGKDPNFKCQLN